MLAGFRTLIHAGCGPDRYGASIENVEQQWREISQRGGNGRAWIELGRRLGI
jgi:hypothetical protein